MSQPTLSRQDDVFILHLGEDENRFTPTQTQALRDALSEVERQPPPRALVTAATGRFYSNGLDLEWMAAHPDYFQHTVDAYHRLLAAFLQARVPTVAAIQGHAFAGGAMFAIAHDIIVMRADRGYWCLPEVDLGLPFTRSLTALLQARLPGRTAHEAMVTGRRYGGVEAATAGIVDETTAESDVLPTAIECASRLADKDPDTLATIKQRLYGATLTALKAQQHV